MQDLDIDFKLVLNGATYDRLMEQIQKDCALLEALRVMDYSMLLGVHYLSWGPDEWHPPKIKVILLWVPVLVHYLSWGPDEWHPKIKVILLWLSVIGLVSSAF